ncbi:hypothetical protein PIB30_035818 [Stylosanthes scabra]|uniref:Retrotransposon gag domain-containing protein n=1 Tax=Stylosanthes scabra TaxID=79078 RepID=A0ABU6XE21_9FABA|nr:hypothetical protein [Stylosanthes scabra]
MVDIQHDNEGGDENRIPLFTPEKGMIPQNKNIQQMEAALKELFERQTREAEIAFEAMKRAEAMATRQQALLEEAEKRDQKLKQKLQNRLSFIDEDEGVGDSRSRTWKPSTVAGNPPAKENDKHPFSLAILSEELPKKFKYPVDMEPYDGISDLKHHLDVFDNRMVLLNASNTIKCKAFTKPEESLWNYLDRFNAECTQIEGLQCQATLMTLVKGLREDTPFLKSLTKSRKDLPREDRSRREQRFGKSYYNPLNVSLATFIHEVSQVKRIPAPRAIKNSHRDDRNAYCKYHKQNGHDTEDCRDLLEFVERGLKKGKFREYTRRSNDRGDDKRTRQRVSSPDKSAERKDEPKEGVTRREIKMISGGLPDEGNPPSRKAAKRSKHSCLAVEVMPRALHDKPPPKITFSSEKDRKMIRSDLGKFPVIKHNESSVTKP